MTCSFDPCTCNPSEDFCSPTCRQGIGEPGEPCKCGHAECTATTGSATVEG